MPNIASLLLGLPLLAVGLGTVAAAADDSPWLQEKYELGQGLRFPALGLDIGGYTSLQYENLKGRSPVFSLHDLSLFVSKRLGSNWSVFTEMEVGDALRVSEDGDVTHNEEFDIERLYADYRHSPEVTLRLGKFLTPVGRWNMIHADPLVWTVSRPLTATAPFARHATGAMLYGAVPAAGRDLDYWFFVDDTVQLDHGEADERAYDTAGSSIDTPNQFDRAVGGRLLYHFLEDRFSVGASYVYLANRAPQPDQNLVGVDFLWSSRHVELSGEAVIRTVDDGSHADARGAYVQAVVPLPQHFYAIGRYERYRADDLDGTARLHTFGLTYRPRPPLSLKLEYRNGADNERVAPDGWLASLAILF